MSRRIKILIPTILAVLLIIISLFVWMKQPVDANIKVIGQSADVDAEVEQALPIETDYFTTTAPPGFKIKSQNEQSAGPQMIQIFATSSSNSQLAITIGKLPADGFTGLSDYIYRKKNPDLYTIAQLAGLPDESVHFYGRDSDNETTVFWPHSNLYAAISVSGSTQLSISDSILKSVIEQWIWK